ncbi:MAG: hypothetical protein ACLFVU_02405 [Phycisphaerae bacterium]
MKILLLAGLTALGVIAWSLAGPSECDADPIPSNENAAAVPAKVSATDSAAVADWMLTGETSTAVVLAAGGIGLALRKKKKNPNS